MAIVVMQPQAAAPVTPGLAKCAYDSQLLKLGFDAFDQDMTGGWRALSKKPGCEDEAANIVRDYRQKYESMMPVLYWHEAQLRANVGESNEAISLMKKAYQPGFGNVTGWNQYINATIAFLRNDRSGFMKARADLDHLKKPDDWPQDAEWPQNISVVEGLWNCFSQPYKIASGTNCRPDTKRP
jgi:hypothetical protein